MPSILATASDLVLAKEIEAEIKDGLPELGGFTSDLLNAAVSEVNWYEIAEAMLDGMDLDDGEGAGT